MAVNTGRKPTGYIRKNGKVIPIFSKQGSGGTSKNPKQAKAMKKEPYLRDATKKERVSAMATFGLTAGLGAAFALTKPGYKLKEIAAPVAGAAAFGALLGSSGKRWVMPKNKKKSKK